MSSSTTPAERDWVRAEQRRVRRRLYRLSIPAGHEQTTYDDLPEGLAALVRPWLGSRSRTLFLATEVDDLDVYAAAAYAVLNDADQRGQWVTSCDVGELLDDLAVEGFAGSSSARIAEQCDVAFFGRFTIAGYPPHAVDALRQLLAARASEGRRQIIAATMSRVDLEIQLGSVVAARLARGAQSLGSRQDW